METGNRGALNGGSIVSKGLKTPNIRRHGTYLILSSSRPTLQSLYYLFPQLDMTARGNAVRPTLSLRLLAHHVRRCLLGYFVTYLTYLFRYSQHLIIAPGSVRVLSGFSPCLGPGQAFLGYSLLRVQHMPSSRYQQDPLCITPGRIWGCPMSRTTYIIFRT